MMSIDNSVAMLNYKYGSTPAIKIDNSYNTKLKEQTDKFEAFFIKKILDISIKHENSIFGKDAGDKIYNSMYHDFLSNSMSGKFGFSELLFDFLKQRG
jgi:Rod binding domain-containing protein